MPATTVAEQHMYFILHNLPGMRYIWWISVCDRSHIFLWWTGNIDRASRVMWEHIINQPECGLLRYNIAHYNTSSLCNTSTSIYQWIYCYLSLVSLVTNELMVLHLVENVFQVGGYGGWTIDHVTWSTHCSAYYHSSRWIRKCMRWESTEHWTILILSKDIKRLNHAKVTITITNSLSQISTLGPLDSRDRTLFCKPNKLSYLTGVCYSS